MKFKFQESPPLTFALTLGQSLVKCMRMALTICVALIAMMTWAAEPAKTPPKFHPPELELLQDVEIGTGGGRPILVNILRPKQLPKETMTALLWIHGGGWSRGGHRPGTTYNRFLTEHGYFLVSVGYRLSGEACWPAQIEDCKLAVRWLRANADKFHIDPEHIGCIGQSSGGHLAACVGVLGNETSLEGKGGYEGVSSRVQAVVSESGPTDLVFNQPQPANRPENPAIVQFMGGSYATKSKEWLQASPAAHVPHDAPPFLLVHGDRDSAVSIKESERLFEALKKSGVPAEFIRVKNGEHDLKAKAGGPPAEPDIEAVHAAIVTFFDKQLKPSADAHK